MTTPILLPDRVVDTWEDADYLKKVGRQGHRIDDRDMLFSRGNPALGTEEEQPFTEMNGKTQKPA